MFFIFVFFLTSCGPKTPIEDPNAEGKTLRIFSFNDEFKTRMEACYPDYNRETQMIGDVKVEWLITPNNQNQYQKALDEALIHQHSGDTNKIVDIFIVEADYAKKYTASSAKAALPVSEFGLTEEDLSEQFPYTIEIVSGSDGLQRAVSWQATPGVMIYNRDIAIDVFGTDDPQVVQEKMKDWQTCLDSAEELKAKDYRLTSSIYDLYRLYSNNTPTSWIQGSRTVSVPIEIEIWAKTSKAMYDKGYIGADALWSPDWANGAKNEAFSYFGPAWFIDFTLIGNSLETPVANGGKIEAGNGTYGRWAVCQGPSSFFWGGSWICGAVGTDNKTLVGDIMRRMTCSSETATTLTKTYNEFTNHQSAMEALALDENFGSPFLGGQNFIREMYLFATTIDTSYLTKYDQGLTETFQEAMLGYFDYGLSLVPPDENYDGEDLTYEEALDIFEKKLKEVYPELLFKK